MVDDQTPAYLAAAWQHSKRWRLWPHWRPDRGRYRAFIGDRLLPRLGIHLGTGMVALVVNATLGAIVLLIILRLISGVGGGGFRRRW
jgi:hypothetical protein